MNMLIFLFYTLILIFLGIIIRFFWVQIYIAGVILLTILGILLSSAITAITFQFFTWMFTQGEGWGSFTTYFLYSLVFFVVATIVYLCVISDIINIVIQFFRNVFKN